ncbi:MAG: oligoendopeptidase F, partial [Candidatus Natronoplasma sp.]
MSDQSTSADGVEWDLTDLYESHEDPELEEGMEELIQKAERFRKKYKGKIEEEELEPDELRVVIEEYEEIYELLGKIKSFASLYHAMDTQDPDRGALLQRAE